jgi:hypothetical protein
MLVTKMKQAKLGLQQTQKSFDELSNSIKKDNQIKWAREEADALVKWGKALSIYDLNVQKGQFSCKFHDGFPLLIIGFSTFPSRGTSENGHGGVSQ